MPTLSDTETLRAACQAAEREARRQDAIRGWQNRLSSFLEWFQTASEAERATEEFQRRLWNDNAVSKPGRGNVNVDAAIADQNIREWLAQELSKPYPDASIERRMLITLLFDAIRERVFPLCNRAPRLKLYRVMATAFPADFTTIVHGPAVRRLHRELFGRQRKRSLFRHYEIMDRLEEVLEPTDGTPDAIAFRMKLPWILLNVVLPSTEDSTEEPSDEPGATKLSPSPPARRRRGLTGIPGGFQTVLGILDFVGEGASREELLDQIRSVLPNYKENSLPTVLSVLVGELGVIRHDGDVYILTDRGETVLESEDPSDLSDWLLTRVLGVDKAIVALRDRPLLSRADLTAEIKSCNPGWTTDYTPSNIVQWLLSFGIIEKGGDGYLRLTEAGTDWANQIHWQPEALQPALGSVTNVQDLPEARTSLPPPLLPDLNHIISAVQSRGHFKERDVRDLHAGLWGHSCRHFAVLTGLSGTGKTLLATSYARALWQDGRDEPERLCIIPVQPGWHDPGAMLGYVNPMRPNAYVRTPFLEFILLAHQEPSNPYVAVLDEMNLSHPEQYLAPVLSAMETGASVDLHREGIEFDGVPSTIPYPRNLVLIGTVNMDETTHGLSDKVLDRAFTLEFWDVDVSEFGGWKDVRLASAEADQAKTILIALHDALRPARLHFGWRTIEGVLGFLVKSATSGDKDRFTRALDSVIYSKILPKLRGDDSARFREALDGVIAILSDSGLSRSKKRVSELKLDLDSTGTARFWR